LANDVFSHAGPKAWNELITYRASGLNGPQGVQTKAEDICV